MLIGPYDLIKNLHKKGGVTTPILCKIKSQVDSINYRTVVKIFNGTVTSISSDGAIFNNLLDELDFYQGSSDKLLTLEQLGKVVKEC